MKTHNRILAGDTTDGKVMLRPLTDIEESEIVWYIGQNPHMLAEQVVEHFEWKFATPITKTCIVRLKIQGKLDGRIQ